MRSRRFKLALLGMGSIIIGVFIILPYISVKLDKLLYLPESLPFPFNLIGIFFITGGVILSLECVSLFFNLGKGTPVPFLPPKNLITTGPYTYTRNPMVLGLGLCILGLALLLKTISLLAFLCLFSIFGVFFIKFYEENDLQRRFGEEYLQYKERTPFLLPRWDSLFKWGKLFLIAILKGTGKAIMMTHLFFTFWRKVDQSIEGKGVLEMEDAFWPPPWVGLFGQLQRVLLFVIPLMIGYFYIVSLWFGKWFFILIPLITQIIDLVIERRFINSMLDKLSKDIEE